MTRATGLVGGGGVDIVIDFAKDTRLGRWEVVT